MNVTRNQLEISFDRIIGGATCTSYTLRFENQQDSDVIFSLLPTEVTVEFA